MSTALRRYTVATAAYPVATPRHWADVQAPLTQWVSEAAA